MSLRDVRNKLKTYWTKDRVFDSLFLIVLCFIYSIFAIINLGDTVAPQTFYRLGIDEELSMKLTENVKNPTVVFYSGITRNDFDFSYALATENQKTEDIKYSTKNIDGPFRWINISTNGEASQILLKNIADRDIDLGELAIYSNDKKVDFKVEKYNDFSSKPSAHSDINNLTDEQDIIRRDSTVLNSSYFDELYFAQTAYQYATGQPGYEDVHPPLGKIIQSIPIKISGKMTPFTWRIMGTITGVLIIVATYFLAKEIFHSAGFARIAAILVSLSGLHFVQTRVGTIDSYLCLFTVLSFLFMMKFINSKQKLRYFVLSGFFFGCAFSVKWSGAFAGFGLAILFFANIKKNIFKKENLNWLFKGVCSFIVLPLTIYCSSYLFFSQTTNAHNLGDIYNQSYSLFTYHSNETTPHAYSSKWYTWPITLKPMLYAVDTSTDKVIYLMGNYAIAYVSIIGLIITAYHGIKHRDKTSLIILIAWLSLFIPYAFITRTMFLYHYLPASIFAILAIVNIFYKIPGTRKIIMFYLTLVLISFIISYPKMVGV